MWCAGSGRKPPNGPRPSRRLPAPTPGSPTAAAGRSPPWRSPAGRWPAALHRLTELEVTTEEVTTGRARSSAGACNTAVEPTGAARARTLPSWGPTPGPNGCMQDQLRPRSSGPSRRLILRRPQPRQGRSPGWALHLGPGCDRRTQPATRSQPTIKPHCIGANPPRTLDKARPHGCGNADRCRVGCGRMTPLSLL